MKPLPLLMLAATLALQGSPLVAKEKEAKSPEAKVRVTEKGDVVSYTEGKEHRHQSLHR